MPRVDTDNLLDANGVAKLLGLARRNSVSVYQKRYPDMPRPVVDLSGGKTKLWNRPDVIQWARKTGRMRGAD